MRVDKNECEIDVLVSHKGKSVVVLCDLSNELSFDHENYYFLKKKCDKLILVTLSPISRIKKKIISTAKALFSEVDIITGKDIYNIGERVKEIIGKH